MDKNYDSISPEQMRKLASSPAAKALMAMLQKNHPTAMDRVVAGAQSGDMAQAQQLIQALMTDPKAQALIKTLQEDTHG